MTGAALMRTLGGPLGGGVMALGMRVRKAVGAEPLVGRAVEVDLNCCGFDSDCVAGGPPGEREG